VGWAVEQISELESNRERSAYLQKSTTWGSEANPSAALRRIYKIALLLSDDDGSNKKDGRFPLAPAQA